MSSHPALARWADNQPAPDEPSLPYRHGAFHFIFVCSCYEYYWADRPFITDDFGRLRRINASQTWHSLLEYESA